MVVELRVPDEAHNHSSFTFCLIFLTSHDAWKIWMILFWPRVHRWEKLSQSGKMPPGGKAEIENGKYAKSEIFNFNSSTGWHFWTFTPLFLSMEYCPKKVSFRFLIHWVLTNLTEILLHVYQVSLKFHRVMSNYKSQAGCNNVLGLQPILRYLAQGYAFNDSFQSFQA